MRLELLETAKSLPSTFSKILELLNGESVSQAMKYYGDFARDAHTEKEVGLIITEILDVASLLRPSVVEFTLNNVCYLDVETCCCWIWIWNEHYDLRKHYILKSLSLYQHIIIEEIII